MTGIGIYDVALGNLQLIYALAALAGGIALGLLVGRAMNVVWHEETNKAITKMDKFGIIILLCYIVFHISQKDSCALVCGASIVCIHYFSFCRDHAGAIVDD